jgi:hypothetical protein
MILKPKKFQGLMKQRHDMAIRPSDAFNIVKTDIGHSVFRKKYQDLTNGGFIGKKQVVSLMQEVKN